MKQLSGLDASFLAMERASTVGHVTGVLILDTGGRFGTAPRVAFNAAIGPHRRWAYVSIPLYLAGAQILGHYPVSAIVDGVGLNITVVTTNGMLGFGFVSDRDLIPDLWSMADAVPLALGDLAAAVSS